MTIERSIIADLLEREEGYRRQAYDDATGETARPGTTLEGWVTVGIGRNLIGKGISPMEAKFLLHNDIEECVVWCRENLSYFRRLSAIRAAVLVSMRFQLGAGGLLGFRRFHAALAEDDYDKAALEMLDSRAARQTPERWHRAAEMMRTNEWILS